jgi:hypothetical protein
MMQRCTKCVLPASFPGISFDDDGVCSLCRDFAARDTSASPVHLGETLSRVIEQSRAKAGRYDAVVAFSGGKDSAYLLYVLKKQFDLNVLAVTFDNGFSSAACFSNMHNVVTALNVDHLIIKYRPDRLNALVLESARGKVYPDHLTKFGSGVCISCIRIVMTAVLRVAIEKRVPMVMLGNNPGQVLSSQDELIFQDNLIPFPLRRQLFAKLAERTGSWAYDYLMLSAEEYKTNPFPYIISPLPIIGYDVAEIYRAIADLGWSKPTDVDPNSTNCRLNAFGIIRHLNLYRFHPYDYEMSQLVRLGTMTREAALAKVSDVDGSVMDLAAQVEKDLLCRDCCNHRRGC